MAVLDIRGAIIGATSMAIKAPCLVATTGANITLSGVQTVDGVTVGSNNERVLVKDQTNQPQNGIYQAATGNWTLTTDFSGSPPSIGLGTLVLVTSGAINQGTIFEQTCSDNPIVIGTSLITFTPLPNATAQAATSVTVAPVASGTLIFAVPTGLAFSPQQWVLIQDKSNSANQMLGQITSYTGGSLVVDVVATAGSGTHSNWIIVLTNSPAAAGYQPPVGSGNVTGPGSAVAGDIAVFSGTNGKLLADGGALGALAGLSSISAKLLSSNAIAFGGPMLNGTLVPSVSGNALTLTLTTLNGNTPSSSDPVFFGFQAGAASGAFTIVAAESPLSITVPAGSTLGFSNATPGRFWVVAVNNSGTVSLAVINCLSGTNIFPLQGQGTCNVTAFGAGGNSAQAFYGASSISGLAYSVLAHVTYEIGNTLSTAGTWSAIPSVVMLYRPGVLLPGQSVQQVNTSSTSATSTSTGSYVVTNNTATITPTSSANVILVQTIASIAVTATETALVQVRRGSSPIGIISGNGNAGSNGFVWPISKFVYDLPATLSAQTYAEYLSSAGATYGGTSGAAMSLTELVA